MRTPGIGPGLEPWKGAVLPLYYVREEGVDFSTCIRWGSNPRGFTTMR